MKKVKLMQAKGTIQEIESEINNIFCSIQEKGGEVIDIKYSETHTGWPLFVTIIYKDAPIS